MAEGFTPFLMFEGKAEEAMNFYVSLFPNSEIVRVMRYEKDMPGPEGTVIMAEFRLGGRSYFCSDSYVHHAFSFTPSISIFVDCASEAELERLYHQLSESGKELMELADYGFSKRFGWVNDRFGVSWQLNLPH